MGSFNITSPDGKKFKVTAPDGASHDEIIGYAQEQMSRMGQPSYSGAQKAADVSSGFGSGLASGTLDTILSPVDAGTFLINKGVDAFTGRPSAQDAPAPSTAIENAIGLNYKPKTGVGDAAKVVGEVGSMVGGGGKLAYEG